MRSQNKHRHTETDTQTHKHSNLEEDLIADLSSQLCQCQSLGWLVLVRWMMTDVLVGAGVEKMTLKLAGTTWTFDDEARGSAVVAHEGNLVDGVIHDNGLVPGRNRHRQSVNRDLKYKMR